ncbi:MAG: HD domain-containing protein [Desulfobacterales bacterium]|jgi:putative hydrolase of HD superfamily|nr:HD domain-containing protein [Desulfobacterales bacterium]
MDAGLIPGGSDRLKRQVEFLLEIDRLKKILRQTILTDRSRQENSVEHSWHIAMAAMVLAEHAGQADIDLCRALRMMLIHDLVEIDAGDTYCYDERGRLSQVERERIAAARIFGMLPDAQALELRGLWEEFERRDTPEARFAHAMDRFQAFMHNYVTEGEMWRRHAIRREQVLARMQPVAEGAPALWDYVKNLIRDAVAKGYLKG